MENNEFFVTFFQIVSIETHFKIDLFELSKIKTNYCKILSIMETSLENDNLVFDTQQI